MEFIDYFHCKMQEGKPIFFDGAMGSTLQKTGLSYDIGEDLNVTSPETVRNVHLSYINSGSNVISANTFALNPIKETNSTYNWKTLFLQGMKIAKDCAKEHNVYVAWDSGQIGKLMPPMGEMTFDSAYNAYKEVAILAQECGADLALIETQADLYEVKAAALAIKENTHLPYILSMTFTKDLRTLTGANVLTVCTYLEALRPLAIGFNCGTSLKDDLALIKQFASYTLLPIIVQPNAGLPIQENGVTLYKQTPQAIAEFCYKARKEGASIIGGCCGTTREHIKCIVDKCKDVSCKKQKRKSPVSRVCTGGNTQELGGEAGPVIIGERINPTGKKRYQEALKNCDMHFILNEAKSQLAAGATILDVNTGMPGVDEEALMLKAITALQENYTNTPLQIDSSSAKVLEKALRYYNGKPLINSVNGKTETLQAILPLVAKYGGTVVALCIDENGISPNAKGRVAVAKKIINECGKYGIKPSDIVIDTLTLTVSAQQQGAKETVAAIRTLKKLYGKRGLRFILGVSNISFGLPARSLLNSRFLMMALCNGLDCCIINPLNDDMQDTIRAYRALYGFDKSCLEYIKHYCAIIPTKSQKEASPATITDEEAFIKAICTGSEAEALEFVQKLLVTKPPVYIIDNCIVKALDSVGSDYEKGVKFLPQLLLSAKAVSASFEVIKKAILQSGIKEDSKGDIVLATVKGDIHDIGKNIVKAMLENYGYTVHDLGKNVAEDTIVEYVKAHNIKLVGLSALMTTTVVSMECTIAKIESEINAKEKLCYTMVGGAVLTCEYAKKIKADYYVKDAMASVAVARKIFGK